MVPVLVGLVRVGRVRVWVEVIWSVRVLVGPVLVVGAQVVLVLVGLVRVGRVRVWVEVIWSVRVLVGPVRVVEVQVVLVLVGLVRVGLVRVVVVSAGRVLVVRVRVVGTWVGRSQLGPVPVGPVLVGVVRRSGRGRHVPGHGVRGTGNRPHEQVIVVVAVLEGSRSRDGRRSENCWWCDVGVPARSCSLVGWTGHRSLRT